jgi:hypothetical protein
MASWEHEKRLKIEIDPRNNKAIRIKDHDKKLSKVEADQELNGEDPIDVVTIELKYYNPCCYVYIGNEAYKICW